MREYKFRLFEMGEMVYFTFDDVFYNLVVVNNGVTEIPVMQYTGLKDKNDVDIYEGDIVRVDCGTYFETSEVTYRHGAFKLDPGFVPGTLPHSEDILVIGNIYEKKQ